MLYHYTDLFSFCDAVLWLHCIVSVADVAVEVNISLSICLYNSQLCISWGHWNEFQ